MAADPQTKPANGWAVSLSIFRETYWTITVQCFCNKGCNDTHTHTRLMALFPGLPRWAGTRKAKPIWILLKQETVSGSGFGWAICKSATRSRQITIPLSFYRLGALPPAQPTESKHWRHNKGCNESWKSAAPDLTLAEYAAIKKIHQTKIITKYIHWQSFYLSTEGVSCKPESNYTDTTN